jgi:hypothetical protein
LSIWLLRVEVGVQKAGAVVVVPEDLGLEQGFL